MTTKPKINLAALRRRLLAVREAHPELRRGINAALADLDRALGQRPAPTGRQAHNRTRVKKIS